MSVSRRRFVQFFASGLAEANQITRFALNGIAAGFLVACSTFRRLFNQRVRWVLPSTVGDFVIETLDDLATVQSFPCWIHADRFEFPSVAATILDPSMQPDKAIDSDRALIENVDIMIDAKIGTRLFRKHDIVRSDLHAHVGPNANFSISFSPAALFPPLHPSAPVAIDIFNARQRHRDRGKMIRIDFCVDPRACQGGPLNVFSALPTVSAQWPEFNAQVHLAGGTEYSLTRTGALERVPRSIADCNPDETSGEHATLYWVKATFDAPVPLRFALPGPMDGESIVALDPGELTLRIRPGFIDVDLPAGSRVERTRGKVIESNELADSRLHEGNLFAYAWASDAPASTTPLPVEYQSRFCLVPVGNQPWSLAPDPILVPRTRALIVPGTGAQNVQSARFSAILRYSHDLKKVVVVEGVDQRFGELTLTFRSGRSTLEPSFTIRQKRDVNNNPVGNPIQHVVDGTRGRLRRSRILDRDKTEDDADVPQATMILTGDLFALPAAVVDLDLHFDAGKADRPVEQPSVIEVRTQSVTWAGRLFDSGQSVENWVHLVTPFAATGSDFFDPTADYRGSGTTLAKPASLRWDIERDRFELNVDTATKAIDSEIVSIAPEAYRTALAADVPPPHDPAALQFPPFALREHRDFQFGLWKDPANPPKPAFAELTLWEPRTAGAFDTSVSSPAEIFERVASPDFSTSISAMYAGFAIGGSMEPLRDAAWAPDDRCEHLRKELAPYRAVAGKTMKGIRDAVDVIDLKEADQSHRDLIQHAFTDADERSPSLMRLLGDPQTEIAFSPLGGTIDFEWAFEQQRLGLQDLVLRGYLGRYQKNYAIFADILWPWGLRIFTLNLTSRQDSGRLRYCNKWWFAEPFKEYGDKKNIIITNLRPLNSVNFNENEPLLFQADFQYLNGDKRWIDPDRNLQGVTCSVATNSGFKDALTQTVTLDRPQALTLFKDTPMRLHQTRWHVDDDCQGKQKVQVSVASRGELEDVPGLHYDTRELSAGYANEVDINTGAWEKLDETHDQFPNYATNALTLGDGVVRIDRPLKFQDTWHLKGADKHVFQKKITVADVGLMQLVLGGGGDDEEFLKNEGTLTIEEQIVLDESETNNSETGSKHVSKTNAHVTAVVDFPQFSRGTSEVCSGNLAFRIKICPKSFHASFEKQLTSDAKYDATLVADIGVPGFIVLKNCKMQSTNASPVSFSPGEFEICGELLREVFDLLIEKLKSLLDPGGTNSGNSSGKSPFTFELLDKFLGFLVKFRLPMPRIPFGAGSLEHLTFDCRLSLAIDISRSGINSGCLFSFILGDYTLPGFGGLDWLTAPDLSDFAHGIFKRLRPPTLTITPFTIRFSVIAGVRVKPPKTSDLSIPNPFRKVCFDAIVCMSGEGGLAVAFDVGVANGSASITVGLVWCPMAHYVIDTRPNGGGDDKYFSFDEVGIFARIEVSASVLGVVNIFIRVEVMALLKLTCEKGILSHLEASGTATIEVGIFSFDVSFTVDLDPILGIDPKACKRDKFDPKNICALPAARPDELARFAATEFFSFAEVA